VKYGLQNVKSNYNCILESTTTRDAGIRGYFPQLLEFQDFWNINFMLKELYCIFEAPLGVLKFEL